MDADSVAEAVFGLHPTGPMVIHVVDQDYEYWLEVTEVKPASLVDPPWTGGVIIETKPIPAGVMARMPRLNPRPLPETGWRYETAPEFAGAGTEHLAEELQLKQKAAEELIEKNPFPAEQQDQAEPHYAVAREINERQVHDAFGTDRLFANPHMGDPKE